jgi:hypothetical protein
MSQGIKKGEQIMGNRAVITVPQSTWKDKACKEHKCKRAGLYLHWNGGRDSVEGFIKYCSIMEFRDTGLDDTYALARLTQICANFIGGGLSVGVGALEHLDCNNYDNGVYIIGKGWRIVGREHHKGAEQSKYKLLNMLDEINAKQPEEYQKVYAVWREVNVVNGEIVKKPKPQKK